METMSTVEVAMFQEAFPILSTGDLPRALRFYRDLLGYTVTFQFPDHGEPAYVGLDLGPSHLGIGADPSAAGEPGRAGNGRRFMLWVYAEDCDAAVERLRAHGVPVVAEPADQPWGERIAEVADPDGNRVTVATRP
jgi:lactoylglutathione lyase